jgi:hypothetical protein
MSNDDDHSWDLAETREGNVPGDEESFDRKYDQWEKRDWMTWLEENLSFPFQAERKEDDDDAYFTDVADHEPFRLGHKMTVLALEDDNFRYGIIVKAKEEGKIGHVPLSDLEVTSKSDKNYWPVREYVVWFANR